ncbi:GntR family transcriptional regulator [Micromonospora auratinigra]|uniref:GntR family transcriptional regulator n=1 Tax=Micromonospora auratinigra TaxID=261654 RepID=UPI0012FE20C5|nr:GntR family transcriptional regulator [Micromonospora auratinigra]
MPTPHYGQPRYRVIAGELRARIDACLIESGSLLPTEGALMAEFKASRGTIRHALALLRDEGLIETEHGRGTIVRPPQNLNRSAASEMIRQSQKTPATPTVAKLLEIKPGDLVEEEEIVVRQSGKVQKVIQSYRPAE